MNSIFKCQTILRNNNGSESLSWRRQRLPNLFHFLLLLHHNTLSSSLPLPNSLLLHSNYHISLPRRRLRPIISSMSASLNSNAQSDKTVKVVIKGRVQGVFYRDWTVENAKELGLKGWVRNRRDGSVEALFSGTQQKVEEMEHRCRRGPPHAMVTGLQVFPCTSDDDPGTVFECKPTV